VWALRYVLLARYSDFAFCDPDYYPVARDDEQSAADDWWAAVDRGSAEVTAILAHHGYQEPLTSPVQRLVVYRDHKKLAVIVMAPESGGYGYQLSISTSGGGEPDQTVDGFISLTGAIDERGRQPRLGGCPICLEPGTRIATPHGEVPAAEVKPGDLVWTVDGSGQRVAAPVERVVRRATPGPHLMLRLVLSDGRVLVAAGAHPAADRASPGSGGGAYLRDLRTGQPYDGATVVTTSWTLSQAPATSDILPAGPTGLYWANGILVGSTLNS
jgi:hypothetical protein